ncbi:MAG: hypothetical protein ACE5Q6_21000 [Dehalococcoidia bacterium]
MERKKEIVHVPKRPAAGAGTFPVGLLRVRKGKLPPLAQGRETPRKYLEYNTKGCPRCWSPDIRPILTLQTVAWWACSDCFHRWYAQRDDPARLVNRGGFPGLPHRVIGSPKPAVRPGSRNGRKKLPQQVLKVPMMSMRF